MAEVQGRQARQRLAREEGRQRQSPVRSLKVILRGWSSHKKYPCQPSRSSSCQPSRAEPLFLSGTAPSPHQRRATILFTLALSGCPCSLSCPSSFSRLDCFFPQFDCSIIAPRDDPSLVRGDVTAHDLAIVTRQSLDDVIVPRVPELDLAVKGRSE
jgi:hypothetical protein